MTTLTDIDGYPTTRKTHICRICGTNKAGDQLTDLWVDLERMDIIKSATQNGDGHWQGLQRKLRWLDDPDGDGFSPDGNPTRTLQILKVCDPNSDNVNDPDEWVPVPVIRRMKSRNSDQGQQDQHVNDTDGSDSTTARVVQVRKVTHYDTSIDDLAEAAFENDSTRTNFVVPTDQYDMDPDTKDVDQFVNFEVIQYLKHRHNDQPRGQNGSDPLGIQGRGRQTKLFNQYIIDWTDDPATEDTVVVGSDGVNPPYRLDPFQNIVNVNLSALAVEFFDGAL